MRSQLVSELEGRVLLRVGKITLENTKAGLCVTDGWTTNWIICYGNGK